MVYHIPALLKESIDGLNIQPDGIYVDVTFGGGGHAVEILKHLKKGRLIAEEGNQIVGWAALTPVSDRCVYAGVAEISVYVSKSFRGKKIGSLLLQKLIQESEREGIWTLQAGIFPENIASIKIHEANGFHLIGKREKIGQMDGIWRDTMLFERRSKTVGL